MVPLVWREGQHVALELAVMCSSMFAIWTVVSDTSRVSVGAGSKIVHSKQNAKSKKKINLIACQ